MVLNTLSIDPKRIWKGPWRWYNETMLDCCRSLEETKTKGIEFDQFACLGRCNGLIMDAKRPNQRHLYPTKETKEPIIEPQKSDNEKCNDEKEKVVCCDNDMPQVQQEYFSIAEFREDVMVSCAAANAPVVIVSYSRKGLKQTGDGHFSPIAGYHKEKDLCLILDVARFKYPPHWVKTQILYDAMCRIDKSVNKTRGWIVASHAELAKSYFFTFSTAAIDENNVSDINDNICCCSLKFISALTGMKEPRHSIEHIHMHHKDMNVMEVVKCLLLCLPVPLDKYIAIQTEQFGTVLDEQHKIIKDKLMNGLRDTGMYSVVAKIFEANDQNKELIERFEKCFNKIEIVTLMVLVIGGEKLWNKFSNDKLAKELCELSMIDQKKYPELQHEVASLRAQIVNLKEYLLSMYDGDLEKGMKDHGKNDKHDECGHHQ